MRETFWTRTAAGAASGLLATIPMTVAMELLHRRLPPREQHPLPPRRITAIVARRAGLRMQANERRIGLATLVTHLAYGATVGAIAAPLAARVGPGAASGALYGVAVWIVSYLGWLPALGILPSASRQPPRRNTLMIVAHLVWGSVFGLLLRRWQHGGAKWP